MPERTQSAISISAPAQAVLDVIADVESYPAWAGGVRRVSILATREARVEEAEFVVDTGILKDTYVLRYTWDVSQDSTGVVSWTLVRAQSLAALDGSYTLEALDGGTQVTYRLAVELKVPLPGLLRRRAEKSIVGTALDDLRTRVEADRV